MKAEELMLGDLVQGFIPDTYSQVVGIINEYRLAIIGGGAYMELSIDDVSPIPLTPEIFEKNFQESLPGINLMYQLRGPYCAMNEDRQWVFGLVKVDGENSGRFPLVKISFVHELQHALRLCGIKKTIEI